MTYYLCTLRLAPDYLDKELGIGDTIIIKTIGKTSGRTDKQVRDSLTSLGDLGKVALVSRQSQRSMDTFFTKAEKSALTVQEVFTGLQRLANIKGNQSEQDKQSIMLNLMFRCKGQEVQYLVRWIQGNLKIGFGEASMQSALAKTFYDHYTLKGSRTKEGLEIYEGGLKRAICEYPHQGHVIQQLQ